MPSIARLARATAAAGLITAVAACGSPSAGHGGRIHRSGSTVSPARVAQPAGTWTAIVSVSVATLWAQPAALRPLDAPSASNPVNIPLWLSRMTTADRAWLVGRLQTQVLYGTAVSVMRQQGRWSFVAVPGQPTQLNQIGYPGWLPTRQLTGNLSLLRLPRTTPVAIVTRKTAWLRDPATFAPRIQISFATRLRVLGVVGRYDVVATPNGGKLAVRKAAVAAYRSVTAVPHPTGAQLVATARQFLGLPYLWGGTSAFGFDCSGFTYTVFRRYGISLPRDADRQALHGIPVARGALRPGDLAFFAGDGGTGAIHHVAMYVGSGNIIEAPRTGEAVRIVALSTLAAEYAGARRYL